jgi:hypothetical protein
MANSEWILRNTLENLKADVELCEKARSPDYDLLGTLRVNLEVAERNLCVCTSSQTILFAGLFRRARVFLGETI